MGLSILIYSNNSTTSHMSDTAHWPLVYTEKANILKFIFLLKRQEDIKIRILKPN